MVHAYLRIVAIAGGLDPESIRVAPMAGDNMLAAMQTRAIDGISTVLPWTRKGTVEGTRSAGRERRRRRPAAPDAARLQRGRGEARDLREAEIALRRRWAAPSPRRWPFVRADARGTLAILKKTFATFDDAVLADAIEVVRKATPASRRDHRRGAGERRELQRRGAADEGRGKLTSYDGLSTDQYIK